MCVHCGSCSVVFVDPLIGRPCSGSAASVLPMGQPGRCGESGVCEGWVEGGVCVERCVWRGVCGEVCVERCVGRGRCVKVWREGVEVFVTHTSHVTH